MSITSTVYSLIYYTNVHNHSCCSVGLHLVTVNGMLLFLVEKLNYRSSCLLTLVCRYDNIPSSYPY